MNKVQEVSLWGRELKLSVVYDCYAGENILPVQREALQRILAHWDVVDGCKEAVIAYCETRDQERIREKKIENIFKYVVPQQLFIKRTENVHLVYLMCAYRFNEDDGIAVEFTEEQMTQVGSQNII